jgi:hypothetical protein
VLRRPNSKITIPGLYAFSKANDVKSLDQPYRQVCRCRPGKPGFLKYVNILPFPHSIPTARQASLRSRQTFRRREESPRMLHNYTGAALAGAPRKRDRPPLSFSKHVTSKQVRTLAHALRVAHVSCMKVRSEVALATKGDKN